MHTLTHAISTLPHLLAALPVFDAGSLLHSAAVLFASDPPIKAENMIKEIATWLTKILSAVAFLFLIIDLFKHVATSPRDLGAAGKDIFVMIVLIAVAAKAEEIVKWGQSLL
jgi:hypothetical protein